MWLMPIAIIGGSRPQLDEISNTFYAKSYYIY
jgi:hypothetical protein